MVPIPLHIGFKKRMGQIIPCPAQEDGCRRRAAEAGPYVMPGPPGTRAPCQRNQSHHWRGQASAEDSVNRGSPGKGGICWCWLYLNAKRVDGKPGSVAFFMECWTVAPVKKSHWLGTGRYQRVRELGRPQRYPVCVPGSPHWTAAKTI